MHYCVQSLIILHRVNKDNSTLAYEGSMFFLHCKKAGNSYDQEETRRDTNEIESDY